MDLDYQYKNIFNSPYGGFLEDFSEFSISADNIPLEKIREANPSYIHHKPTMTEISSCPSDLSSGQDSDLPQSAQDLYYPLYPESPLDTDLSEDCDQLDLAKDLWSIHHRRSLDTHNPKKCMDPRLLNKGVSGVRKQESNQMQGSSHRLLDSRS